MSKGNDIEVRVGAETVGLDRGMTDAARKVREGGREMENGLKDSADRMQSIAGNLQKRLVGLFSIGAIVSFVRSTKEAVTQAEASYRGLEAVANFAGVGIGKAMESAGRVAADGLMTTAEASKALQNLLARGYSLEQAENTLLRLKDSAAFNRAAHLSMGEAVVTATEGLKNENSVLVDNAGVTKNVSKMWEDYAAKIGKGVNQLTQADKIQAEYNGVMAETEAQMGNAAKASEGLQGQQAKLNANWENMKIQIGEALVPAFAKLAEWGSWLVSNVFTPLLKITKIWGAALGALAVDFSILWDAVTNFDFDGIMEKRTRNLQTFADTAKEIWNEKAGSSFQPSGDGALGPGVNTSGGGGTPKKKAKKSDGPVELFGGSFVAANKDVASFIKEQFDDVNAMQAEIAAEAVQIAEKSKDDRIQIEDMWISERAARAEEEVNLAADAAYQQYQLGLVTKEQLLAAEEQFENKRTAIREQALQERLAMIDPLTDPVAYQAILLQLEELERGHAARVRDIRGEQAEEENAKINNVMQSLESGLMKVGNTLLTNWRNVGSALRSVMANIGQTIIQEVVLKPLAAEVTAWAKKRALALQSIGTKAADAGAGAAASQASIPYAGPALALAAMGAVYAGVMGMSSNVPSAAGGYDIPAGVNPLTQLHEKEMVLPAKYADVVRGMADGGGGGATVNNKIVNVLDKHEMAGALGSTREFERAVLNVIQLNPSAIG
jgi:hypothetical protein